VFRRRAPLAVQLEELDTAPSPRLGEASKAAFTRAIDTLKASPDRRLHKAAFTRATDTPRAPPDRRLHKAAFTRAAAGAGARSARAAAANLPQAGGSRRAIRGLGLVELHVDGTEHDRQSLEHAQPVLAAPCITHGQGGYIFYAGASLA